MACLWQGVTGFSGATGVQGARGKQGCIGPDGVQGPIGSIGADGPRGLKGVTGLVGATGIEGHPGCYGDTGIQGDTGIIGLQGRTGLQGGGQTGVQGITGLQNVLIEATYPDPTTITDPTILYNTIDDALFLDIGTDGTSWIQISAGSKTGATGLVGPSGGGTGLQGQTGILGPTGIQGLTGFYGQTGIQGVTGFQGQTGIQGLTGFYGQTGISGQTGIQGQTGIRGITGLANFIEAGSYPTVGVPPTLLWNYDDNTLFAGITGAGPWVQISAGSMQGSTGVQASLNRVCSWTIGNPVAGGIPGPQMIEAGTVTKISSFVTAATSVSFNIYDRTNVSQTGTKLMTTDQTATTTDASTVSFASASLPANSWLWLQIDATSGSPPYFTASVAYTV